jgi:hypothetical protein
MANPKYKSKILLPTNDVQTAYTNADRRLIQFRTFSSANILKTIIQALLSTFNQNRQKNVGFEESTFIIDVRKSKTFLYFFPGRIDLHSVFKNHFGRHLKSR